MNIYISKTPLPHYFQFSVSGLSCLLAHFLLKETKNTRLEEVKERNANIDEDIKVEKEHASIGEKTPLLENYFPTKTIET